MAMPVSPDHGATVAVQGGLRPFREALRQAGFRVLEWEGPDNPPPAPAQVLVTSGLDENLLGVAGVRQAMPVVDADGRTPAEVVEAVRATLARRGPAD
ncbi:MAG: YkuS family protein [Clostridia bacterium]|nr:YkuS family protein [Clostridia bacterium]